MTPDRTSILRAVLDAHILLYEKQVKDDDELAKTALSFYKENPLSCDWCLAKTIYLIESSDNPIEEVKKWVWWHFNFNSREYHEDVDGEYREKILGELA